MAHSHDHAHHHAAPTHLGRAFIIGIVLNLGFVVVEATAGFWTHSLALLTDAGHNLSDVAGLAFSLVGLRLAKMSPTRHYTYGYSKATVLIALLNALILLVAIGGIGYEAVLRVGHPEPLAGGTIAWVAGVGILVNVGSALLFFRDKDHDLNVKGAYLHLAADALVSLGVVIAGVTIIYTGWYWIDSLISFGVIIVILWSTWGLLRDSLRLSLDGVPPSLSVEKIRSVIRKTPDVVDVHHLHVWAMSTTQNAMTAHIVVAEAYPVDRLIPLKEHLRHEMEHLQIQHCTFEVEFGLNACEELEHEAH